MQNRKNVSKGALLAGLLLLLPAALLTLFISARDRAAPTLVKDGSFFSDFVVEEDRVYFLCRLTIHNPRNEQVPVKIRGDFSADKEGGLVLGRELFARRLDGDASTDFLALDAAEKETILQDRSRLLFLLPPGDHAFWVVFSGLHGENSVKQDRLLPPITISPLVDVTPEVVSAAMDCRIVKDPEDCDTFLVDGTEISLLACGPGGYGFTSAVPFDYGFNEVPDLLYTYSWGSGMHRSHLVLFDRTAREEQELYVYYPDDVLGGSDLLVELEPDGSGYPAIVYTADVTVNGDDYTDLSFTKRTRAGVVVAVLPAVGSGGSGGPVFLPDSKEYYARTEEPELVEQLPENMTCIVRYGGAQTEISGETAAELYRICLEAQRLGEEDPFPRWDEMERLSVYLCFENIIPNLPGPWFSVQEDELCTMGFSTHAFSQLYLSLPAGTYDALLEVLTRNGVLSTSPGERIEGNEIYGIFEQDGVYTVQLYDGAGALVWAYGPVNRRPEVKQEEDALWSVSVQAGTGIGTRWTVYYAPEEGLLSPAYYGVLARQGERLVRALGNGTLELCILFHPGAGAVLHEFSEARAAIVDPFLSAAFTEDGRAVTVTYLAGEDCHEVTETVPLPEEFCP